MRKNVEQNVNFGLKSRDSLTLTPSIHHYYRKLQHVAVGLFIMDDVSVKFTLGYP
jgi:hypothetical protein